MAKITAHKFCQTLIYYPIWYSTSDCFLAEDFPYQNCKFPLFWSVFVPNSGGKIRILFLPPELLVLLTESVAFVTNVVNLLFMHDGCGIFVITTIKIYVVHSLHEQDLHIFLWTCHVSVPVVYNITDCLVSYDIVSMCYCKGDTDPMLNSVAE